jgi:DNA-directed RNA polymerase subunit RPC12/RpoP
MDSRARDLLTEAVAKHGAEHLILDSRQCEGVLRDAFRDRHRRELSVILAAVRERVAADLRSSSGSPQALERQIVKLARRLRENQGLELWAARWAVEGWVVALGRMKSTHLSFEMSCPYCSKRLKVGTWVTGFAVKCPYCSEVIAVTSDRKAIKQTQSEAGATLIGAASGRYAGRIRIAGYVFATSLLALALICIAHYPVVGHTSSRVVSQVGLSLTTATNSR